MESEKMTITQAAARVGMDESTIRHAIKLGHIPVERISARVVLIKEADLTAWENNPALHKRGPKPKTAS